jgi:hypothetical protein
MFFYIRKDNTIMANVKNGVIGPDGKQGMKNREIIAKVVEREEKNGTQTGYYMNAQLAQYNGSPNAKGNAQSSPQLAKGHEFGDGKKSYDIRISKSQYDALLANSKVADGPKGSKICGFTADLMTTKDNGLMPKIDTAQPTTSKKFDDKAWQAQNAATAKAFQKGEAARAAAKEAEAEVAAEAEVEAEVPEV